MKEKKTMAITFTVLILILMVIGIAMMFSVSFTAGLHEYKNYYYFIMHQSAWFLIGTVLMIAGIMIDYRTYEKKRLLFYFAGFSLLAAVLIFGKEVNGAKRWLNLGVVSIQPSEFAKLFIILYMADVLAYYKKWNLPTLSK